MAAGTPARVGLSRCTGAVVPAKVVSCDADAGVALGAPRADWRGSLPRHAAQTSAAKATGTKRRGMVGVIPRSIGSRRLTHQYSLIYYLVMAATTFPEIGNAARVFHALSDRSEERRVGKEGRFRGSAWW